MLCRVRVVHERVSRLFLAQPAPHPPPAVKTAALVFVAGLLTVGAVEHMLEEAHEARKDNRNSPRFHRRIGAVHAGIGGAGKSGGRQRLI